MPDQSLSMLYWPLFMLGAYLLGAIPFAQVAAKIRGVDLRQVGTGNVGAGNASKQLGKGWGIAVAVLDGLKGLIPVLVARRVGFGVGAASLIGVAAVVGHNWSLWMKGRSGRGLAPSAGLVVGLDPALIAWTGGWAVAGWKIGGGLAGFFGWGLLPFFSLALGRPLTVSMGLFLLSVILMGRRMQGNPDNPLDAHSMWQRAVYDTDRSPLDDAPEPVEDPLTP